MGRIMKPGLACRAMSVEIEKVKKAHRTVCAQCGDYPEQLRLLVTQGAGRNAKRIVLCGECGPELLREAAEKLSEAAVVMENQHFHVDSLRIRTTVRV